MNDELQKQLAELLSKLMATVQDGAAFAVNQIPPLVQEKIALGRVEETAWFVAVTIWMIVCVRYGIKAIAWAKKMVADDGDNLPAFMVVALAFAVGLGPWFVSLHAVALVWVAPRLYIVEWLSGLVKK